MAGDWIPMRVDLMDDPAVISVAGEVGLDEFGVVGRLHRLWSWANKHLTDGNARGVTAEWIDRYLGTPGFAAALINAGWLRTRSGGVEFPNYERWNSQSAKRRVLTADRVKKLRTEKCNAPSVTGALPEKRREEKEEKTKDPPTPRGGVECETVDLEAFSELAAAWTEANLPGAGKVQRTANRAGLFQQRQADPFWRDNWREAIRRAGRSARCRGCDPSWQGLMLDTFLKDPDMLVRILEGQFDDSPNGTGPPKASSLDAARAKWNSKLNPSEARP